MTRTLRASFYTTMVLGLSLVLAAPAAAADLGIRGTQFTIDGQPAFLLGISYYGALGASPETIQRDLDEMQKHGFNWIRVWATWAGFDNSVAAVTGDGKAREPFLGKLQKLVADCDRRGMIVDVTFSRGNGVAGSPGLQSLESHRRAMETVVAALAPYRNWYLDLGNERNINDKRFVGIDELKQLRETVRKLDPKRLVTASHAGELQRDDLRNYLEVVRVDFVSPHRPRGAKSPQQTEKWTRQYLEWMKQLGRVVPVHHQEPFRRGYSRDWEPTAEDFLTDAEGARKGGAAGWCFHNGDQRGVKGGRPRRSFDLREKRLFEQLDEVERKTVELLHKSFKP